MKNYGYMTKYHLKKSKIRQKLAFFGGFSKKFGYIEK